MSQLIDSDVAGQFDRLPPHSIKAEMCLLASLMLDREMVGQVVSLIDRDSFYQADHQIIYDVIVKLYEQNRPIDTVILYEELNKRGLLEEIGGSGYLAQMLGSVPSAAHGAHYAGIVREKALLRQLIGASNDILRDAYLPHEQADLVLDKAEKRIFAIAEKKVGSSIESLGVVAHQVYEMIEEKGRRGLETGFYEIDDMLNGLRRNDRRRRPPFHGKNSLRHEHHRTHRRQHQTPLRRLLPGNEQTTARPANDVLKSKD
jgi:replicative DNA helicase